MLKNTNLTTFLIYFYFVYQITNERFYSSYIHNQMNEKHTNCAQVNFVSIFYSVFTLPPWNKASAACAFLLQRPPLICTSIFQLGNILS